MNSKKTKNMKKTKPKDGSVVRIGPVLAADKLVVRLRYPFVNNLRSLASIQVSQRWISNGPYDVDPVLGSTATPGFAEYSALYSYNRVIKSKIDLKIANYEAFPVSVYLVHSNTDPGTTGITWFDYASGAYNQNHMLAGSNAQMPLRITSTITPTKLVGDKIARTEQNFVGTSTANPVDLTYVGVGLQAQSNLTNGVWLSGHIEFTIEFFDRKNLLTS